MSFKSQLCIKYSHSFLNAEWDIPREYTRILVTVYAGEAFSCSSSFFPISPLLQFSCDVGGFFALLESHLVKSLVEEIFTEQ